MRAKSLCAAVVLDPLTLSSGMERRISAYRSVLFVGAVDAVGAVGAVDAVGAVGVEECVIRETVDVAAWYSWDRRRYGVAFARPSTMRRGIRETVDAGRVSLERPSTFCAQYLLHSR